MAQTAVRFFSVVSVNSLVSADAMTVDELNVLNAERAEPQLLQCCGSRRWARAMVARRPFADFQTVQREADNIWKALDPADWLEAFAAHPRIGESPAPQRVGTVPEGSRPDGPPEWSAREQAGMDTALGALRQRLAIANLEYERRFGFIYIVCATGKTAAELLAIIERRLNHSRKQELLTAAEEQRLITQIRLTHLIGGLSKHS